MRSFNLDFTTTTNKKKTLSRSAHRTGKAKIAEPTILPTPIPSADPFGNALLPSVGIM